MTNLKNSNYVKTQFLTKVLKVFLKEQFDNSTTDEMCSGQPFETSQCFLRTILKNKLDGVTPLVADPSPTNFILC